MNSMALWSYIHSEIVNRFSHQTKIVRISQKRIYLEYDNSESPKSIDQSLIYTNILHSKPILFDKHRSYN